MAAQKRTVTLRPGARGTKRLVEQFGEQLLCVRYRYDRERARCFKTIELVIDERPWTPKRPASETVWVRVDILEHDIQAALRREDARWVKKKKLWAVRYGVVVKLGLEDRIAIPKNYRSLTNSVVGLSFWL